MPGREAETVAAVDVGTSKVLVAVAAPEEDGLRVLGVGRAPSGGVRRGAVVDLAAASSAIAAAAERARRVAGVPLPPVLLGSAGGHFVAGNRQADLRFDPPAEVEDAHIRQLLADVRGGELPAGYQAVHAIPREYVVDGYEGSVRPEGMAAARLGLRAHVVACQSTLLRNLYRAAADAGLEVRDFAVAALAAAEAVLTDEERVRGVLLLDAGGGCTQWTAVVGGESVASGVVAMGGAHITADLAAGLGLDLGAAEDVKVRHADAGADPASTAALEWLDALLPEAARGRSPVTAGAFAEMVRARVEETLEPVAQALRDLDLEGALPAGAVLTGGASRLRGLEAAALRALGMPVRRRGAAGSAGPLGTPECAAVVGLLQFAARPHAGGRRLAPLGGRLRSGGRPRWWPFGSRG